MAFRSPPTPEGKDGLVKCKQLSKVLWGLFPFSCGSGIRRLMADPVAVSTTLLNIWLERRPASWVQLSGPHASLKPRCRSSWSTGRERHSSGATGLFPKLHVFLLLLQVCAGGQPASTQKFVGMSKPLCLPTVRQN